MDIKNKILDDKYKLIIIVVSLGIYIYTLAIPAGTISLSHHDDSNFHIVSVNAQNLRFPFFGTAFHIHFDSNDYSYDHFTLGDYFTTEDSPLVLINEGQGKIIVGISLKRGEVINKPEGTILKLYFKNHSGNSGNQNFKFSNEVFSTFNGKRVDIENIDFSN